MSYGMALQLKFPYLDGVPRDEAVNSLHIYVPDDIAPDTALSDTAEAISGIYNGGYDGMTHPIGYYLSPAIDRAHCTLTGYLMADPEPREPFGEAPVAVLAGDSGAHSLPLQVALVVTLYGTGRTVQDSPELSVRRRRGRIYVGPFNIEAMNPTDGPDGMAQPIPSLMQDLATGWGAVVATGVPGTGGAGLAVQSRSAGLPVGTKPPRGTVGEGTIVTHLLVNNGWDIQRRREMDPTGHVVYPA